jgi:hemerythrin
VFIGQVYEQTRQDFDGLHRLSRSTKREILEWIERHWEEIDPAFTFVVASQRRMSTPQLPLFRISEE